MEQASESSIFACPTLFNEKLCYRWKELLTLTPDNGHKKKELRPVADNLGGFLEKFRSSLTQYNKHYYTYW
jgi:hypothetical protein